MPLSKLPLELAYKLMGLLSPLERFSFIRSLGFNLLLSEPLLPSCKIWGLIFRDDSWIRQVLDLSNPGGGSPIPCLIGCDLGALYHGKPRRAYVSLLVHDWTGDSLYIKQSFFASLNDYVYDPSRREITLKRSGLIVHVADAVSANEEGLIRFHDLSRLFNQGKGGPRTNALYYNEDQLYNIGPSCIGGIRDFPPYSKRYLRDICSVRLKFRNGETVYRYLERIGQEVEVSGVFEGSGEGQRWATSWKLAGQLDL